MTRISGAVQGRLHQLDDRVLHIPRSSAHDPRERKVFKLPLTEAPVVGRLKHVLARRRDLGAELQLVEQQRREGKTKR